MIGQVRFVLTSVIFICASFFSAEAKVAPRKVTVCRPNSGMWFNLKPEISNGISEVFLTEISPLKRLIDSIDETKFKSVYSFPLESAKQKYGNLGPSLTYEHEAPYLIVRNKTSEPIYILHAPEAKELNAYWADYKDKASGLFAVAMLLNGKLYDNSVVYSGGSDFLYKTTPEKSFFGMAPKPSYGPLPDSIKKMGLTMTDPRLWTLSANDVSGDGTAYAFEKELKLDIDSHLFKVPPETRQVLNRSIELVEIRPRASKVPEPVTLYLPVFYRGRVQEVKFIIHFNLNTKYDSKKFPWSCANKLEY